MKQLWSIALAAALLAAPVAFAAKVKEHPLIRPYAGSQFFESEVVQFDHFDVPTGRFSFDDEL
ncbi:MAG: hypothetical protein Q9M29_00400 [Mariprofundaceae bacterium]|nr:hypothetical protein [Mariprofundaceae bacterium]